MHKEEELELVLLELSKASLFDDGEVSAALRFLLNAICTHLTIARSGVWFMDAERQSIRCELLIDSANQTEHENLVLQAQQFPIYFAALEKERTIYANDACHHPETSEFADCYLRPLGISSMLDVPIRHRGKMIGIICCEHIGKMRVWNQAERRFLAACADLISRTITAKKQFDAEGRLREFNSRLEVLVTSRTQELSASLAKLKLTQTQLIESEKLAALGSLVAGVAHEVNTPLGIAVTATSGMTEVINKLITQFQQKTLNATELEKELSYLSQSNHITFDNLKRAARLVSDFKQTAVDQVSEATCHFNINSTLQALIGSLQAETRKAKVTIAVSCPSITLYGLPGVLTQILSNLVLNSIRHAFQECPNPTINITLTQQHDAIQLDYRDNGSGIESALHEKIFEPFYTTKRGQGGSGLGLNIVYNLVHRKLQGQLNFTSQPNCGVHFHITFPAQLSNKTN